MSCSVTSVFTFKIESTFDEWAAIFDSAEANKRHSEFDKIKLMKIEYLNKKIYCVKASNNFKEMKKCWEKK